MSTPALRSFVLQYFWTLIICLLALSHFARTFLQSAYFKLAIGFELCSRPMVLLSTLSLQPPKDLSLFMIEILNHQLVPN